MMIVLLLQGLWKDCADLQNIMIVMNLKGTVSLSCISTFCILYSTISNGINYVYIF